MSDYYWNDPIEITSWLDTDGFDNPTPLPDIVLEQSAPPPPLDTTTVPTLDDSLFRDNLTVPDIVPLPSVPDLPNFHSTPSIGQTITTTVPQAQSTTTIDNPSSEHGSEHGSEHDNSGVPPSTPGASSETLPGASNSLSSAASDVTVGVSAVDMARKAAEDFANSKVSERKRRMGRRDDGDGGEDDDTKRRKGLDGSPCSEGDDDAPEKVSHRKYQKRLQKNRDSAYVSRIRRREYTKRLEDGLNRMEKEKIEVQSKYDALQRKFDVVVQELKTMKEATAAKFKAIAGPVGAAGRTATKTKSAGAIFMCIIIFGLCLPGTSPWRTEVNPTSMSAGGGRENLSLRDVKFMKNGLKKGRVWSGTDPIPPLSTPIHWDCGGEDGAMKSIARNMTVVFGPENSGEMMRLLKNRVRSGAVSREILDELKERSKILMNKLELDSNDKKTSLPLPSSNRKSKLLRTVLRKLASVADECFTKELIALLTIRLLPNESVAKFGR